MADERRIADNLFSFAQALVRQRKLAWNEHRIEDAIQDLFLAGWQVYRDEGDAGLAKNRMSSRVANLFRDAANEKKHEPKPISNRLYRSDNEDQTADDDLVSRMSTKFGSSRDDPSLIASRREFIDRLPERQREIVLLRGAGYTDREIAAELGIGLRTVERELSQFRKEQKNESSDE